jgi:tellurite resistance protein TehA-like permease
VPLTEPRPGASTADQPLLEAVRSLNPGYFALVMATGIVSIAMQNHGLHVLSGILLGIAAFCYAVLIVLNVWRAVRFRPVLAADLGDPRRAFGLFTFVAATDVVGTRLSTGGHHLAAFVLLAVGFLAWVVLGYVVPWTAALGQSQRPVLRAANGTWFIWVVASQSVAVLAAALEPAVGQGRRELALVAVFSWSVGVFLYAAVGVAVSSRMLLYDLVPQELTPPYWVAMGSTAITVVAGARITQMADAPMVDATRGLISGSSVVFWVFGTWLIPPLVAAGVWRHVVHRVPLRYEASLWSIVFPLGMYAVAGYYLGQADRLPIVKAIGTGEGWVALAAWAITFAAMLRHLAVTLRRDLSRETRADPAR